IPLLLVNPFRGNRNMENSKNKDFVNSSTAYHLANAVDNHKALTINDFSQVHARKTYINRVRGISFVSTVAYSVITHWRALI
ncbi:MAG: hypothetical protein ACXADH_16620, partial [Candidatus Kariarchaeaceae archaeon]